MICSRAYAKESKNLRQPFKYRQQKAPILTSLLVKKKGGEDGRKAVFLERGDVLREKEFLRFPKRRGKKKVPEQM